MTSPLSSQTSPPPMNHNSPRGSPISKPPYVTWHIVCQPQSLPPQCPPPPHRGHLYPTLLPPPPPQRAPLPHPSAGPPPSKKGKEKAPAPPTPSSAAADDPKYLIPFYDTRLGKAFGDPEKYARLYPHSYEAGEYRRGAYDVSSFTPGHLHPDNKPSPSYAQAASGSGSGGKGKGKVGKPPSPQQGASTVAPPVKKGPPSLPGAQRRFFAPRQSPSVTGLFLSNENTVGPAIDLLALVLREASRDRR